MHFMKILRGLSNLKKTLESNINIYDFNSDRICKLQQYDKDLFSSERDTANYFYYFVNSNKTSRNLHILDCFLEEHDFQELD